MYKHHVRKNMEQVSAIYDKLPHLYPLVSSNMTGCKIPIEMEDFRGKSSINGPDLMGTSPISMVHLIQHAMFDYQRVIVDSALW